VSLFKQYQRKQIAELRPVTDADFINIKPGGLISISAEDSKAGSPKTGDMVARNPKNHADQWLVAAQYFADNFELLQIPSPMTTLEEHVARAIWECGGQPWALAIDAAREHMGKLARAAIAAVCEWEGAASAGWERLAKETGRLLKQACDDAADPAEAMRAKTLDECEALIEEHINILRQNGGFGFGDLLNVQHKIHALKDNGEPK